MTKKNTMTVVKDEEPTSELVKKTEIPETPFVIIETEGRTFGTFGQYKITEDRGTIEEVRAELEPITWNRLLQIMTIVHEMLNNTKK